MMSDKPEDTTFDFDPEAVASEVETSTKAAEDTEKPKGDPRLGLPPEVRVVEDAQPMELALPDENAEGPWIQYNGVATVRIMGPDEWKAAKAIVPQIEDTDKYFEWNYLNSKRIARSQFNDAELQYLLRVDGRFSLVES